MAILTKSKLLKKKETSAEGADPRGEEQLTGRVEGCCQSVIPVVNGGGQLEKTTGDYGNDQHEDLSTKLQKGAKQSHPKKNGGRKVNLVATGKGVSSLKNA